MQTAIYKKLIDDTEEIIIDSKKYILLSMGLINRNIPQAFVKESAKGSNHYGLNFLIGIFKNEPLFQIFYYPDDSKAPLRENLEEICASYIEHYRNALNEAWSEEDFYARLEQLKYLSVKYAMDVENGKLFAVGFFGALVKSRAGGKALTDAELYVFPQFRKLGIAKKLVQLSF